MGRKTKDELAVEAETKLQEVQGRTDAQVAAACACNTRALATPTC
jgi:hypothetical protein